MPKITNKTKSIKGFNVKSKDALGKDRMKTVQVKPGQFVEAEPVETDVFKAWLKSGAITVTADKPAEKSADKQAK